MSNFEKWKYRYEKGWAIEWHIKRLVSLGVLTEEEYTQIVGNDYIAQ